MPPATFPDSPATALPARPWLVRAPDGGLGGEATPASMAIAESAAASDVAAIRAVHRAVADLRRGVPVVLRGAAGRHLVAAAETVSDAGLREMAGAASGTMLLLLAAGRALALGVASPGGSDAPTAFHLDPAAIDPAHLRGFADPTAEALLGPLPMQAAAPAEGHAALALAKLARLLPAVLFAPARVDGTEALIEAGAADVLRHPDLMAYGLVRAAEAHVPLEEAPDARVVAFRGPDAGVEHLAILIGHPERVEAGRAAPLARIHSECFTGDLLGSLRCDCGPQLRAALRRMGEEGTGVLLYLAQEGRGIGLVNKLRAYALQDRGLDTLDANVALGWDADERRYTVAATMLRMLGIDRIRLLTNNPVKLAAMAEAGIVAERVSHLVAGNGINDTYMATKTARFGHRAD